MDRIILLFCSFISCVILVNLLFQFFNDRYLRAYNSKLLYILLPIVSIIIVTPINMFMSPILNMLVNVIWIGFAQCHLDKDNIAVRILFTASKHFVYSLFFYI